MTNYSINIFNQDGAFIEGLGNVKDYPIRHANCRCIKPLTYEAIQAVAQEQEKRNEQLLEEFGRAYHSGKYDDQY